VLGSAWLCWALSQRPDISLFRMLWLLILIPCGLIVFYCMRFFFATLSVMFTKAENIQYLWYQIYRLGMRPDSIYVPWMRFFVLAIVPVGMIASVPARFLLEVPNYRLFLWTIFLSGFTLYLSARFWRFALKRYSSASS
jgi:ABC-2 type transport system permease protein